MKYSQNLTELANSLSPENIIEIVYKLGATEHIEKNDYIGESCSDYIYLVFFKDNEFLDYKDYID